MKMKENTAQSKLTIRSVLALALAGLACLAARPANAQMKEQSATPASAPSCNAAAMQSGMSADKMAAECDAMMQAHAKMAAQIKAQDAELNQLVTDMNQATKKKKLDLMADILTRLVAQRTAADAQMIAMENDMMQASQTGNAAAADCPAMSGASGGCTMNSVAAAAKAAGQPKEK